MALDSYSELQTEIAALLNRTDLTARIPTFIRMAEADMNRRLNTRHMVAAITIQISGETYPLPDDFGGVKSFRIEGEPATPLTYAPLEAFDDAFGTGKPTRYAVTDQIVLNPVPDGSYSARLRYRKLIPCLSSVRRCNWVLDRNPDAYLYGAAVHSAPFLRDDERLVLWRSLYDGAIQAINEADKHEAYPSTLNASGRRF